MLKQRARLLDRFSSLTLIPRTLLIVQAVSVVGFGMAISMIVALMQTTPVPSNPFTAYASVFPGQPIGALDTYKFTCTVREYSFASEPPETRCDQRPTAGVFKRMEAFYSNGVIHRLSFEMRDDVFNLGDLAVMLGLSELQPHGVVSFKWRGQIGMAQYINPSKHFSLLRPVMQLTLTDTRLTKQ